MLHLFTGLDFHSSFMLVLALLFVLFYEAINGFHDTANAVATVIYTRALQAKIAVILSGIFNFLGVILGGLSVAYAIVHLLPTDLLLNVGSKHSLAMMFSMLLAAILWNLGTWYFGLPASSSHTLIGSIIGIGLTNALLTHTPIIDALNVPKMVSIFLSLLISPVVGLLIAGAAIFCLRRFWSGTKKRRRIHMTPTEREQIDGKRKPPFWTRIALIMSAIGVSFSHGANDGQKGIGLIMLVLIALAPAGFVMNMSASSYDISRTQDAIRSLAQYYQQHPQQLLQLKKEVLADHLANQAFISSYPSTAPLSLVDTFVPRVNAAEILPLTEDKPPVTPKPVHFYCDSTQAVMTIHRAQSLLTNITDYQQLTPTQREQARRLMMCLADTTDKLVKLPNISTDDQHLLGKLKKDILNTVEYAPIWIIVAVALALSLGTMIGWRRVVTTIGEKIGKNDMTYAQGVSAQMTAAVSIGIASYTGMPVSTTHVLSSAVAGTMIADGGGVQSKTVKNILLAWFLTLPMSMLLSGGLYYLALQTLL